MAFSRTVRHLAGAALFCTVVAGLIGCASTRVEKSPGPHDRGVRYYRPKPYLLVKPDTTNPNVVDISLTQLPDYSEEYSIHIRAGIGTNKTKVTLADGWNLTGLEVDVDSKFNENVKALTELIKALPKPAPAGAGPDTRAKEDTLSVKVTAYDVPLGYYEAVLSRDGDGAKRLYGWRYVGFLPFAPCPVNSTGSQCVPCNEADLFALVTVGNKLYFRRLSDVGTESKKVKVEEIRQQQKQGDGSESGKTKDPEIKKDKM